MFRKRVPGFRFNNGRLMIFTEEDVKMVDSWPGLDALSKRNSRPGWTPLAPKFRLLRPKQASDEGSDMRLGPTAVKSAALDPALEKLSAFLHFRLSIPPEITSSIERFPSRQWALLRMCKRREQAKDLLEQNPALGFSVAHSGKFRMGICDSIDTAARLSRLKQREIAAWLGFPDSQAWARIISKIAADIVSLEVILALRDGSQALEAEKLLVHLATLNAGVIALISDPSILRLVTSKLLIEVSQAEAERANGQVVHLINDILNLHSRMGTEDTLRAFNSIQEVHRKQQEAVDELADFLKRLRQANVFPEPPLPGTEEIVPIVDATKLWAEGVEQHNCVGTYADAVKKGYCYIYQVLSPERATLSISQGPDGCWQIQQLYLSCNRPVSAETRRSVEEWLSQFSLSI